MSLIVSYATIEHTTSAAFKQQRDPKWGRKADPTDEVILITENLSDEDLAELVDACNTEGDKKAVRAISAILEARGGKHDVRIPNFGAFEGILRAFLCADAIDGWVYVLKGDGKHYPALVTSIEFNREQQRNRDEEPKVLLRFSSYTLGSDSDEAKLNVVKDSVSFRPSDVTNRRVVDVLANASLFKETKSLKADYLTSFARYHDPEAVGDGFAKQFRATGHTYSVGVGRRSRASAVANRKVINDMNAERRGPFAGFDQGCLVDAETSPIPEHPLLRVFDLAGQSFFWINSDFLAPYAYNKSLSKKLVLPAGHRDMLEVLTSDIDLFSEDIIEGKAAGNVVLAMGPPGCGKTLTAEVYSELIERPLYSIHSGVLGTTAPEIAANLQVHFGRVNRWGCVLLLDECDVYVRRRGDDLELNAVVAEFLRVLEYFDGLMFLTTNLPDHIDEAILDRVIARIRYDVPVRDDARAIWHVMAEQFETKLDDALVLELLELFPKISARDIKMLFKLVLKVVHKRGVELTADLFRRYATFRGIEMPPKVAADRIEQV